MDKFIEVKRVGILGIIGNITLYESHKQSGKIKEEIIKQSNQVCDVVIHTNPE